MRLFIYIFILFSYFSNANAYIDPGMGSAFMQIIIAIVSAIAFYISYTFGLIKKLFSKIKNLFIKKQRIDPKL